MTDSPPQNMPLLEEVKIVDELPFAKLHRSHSVTSSLMYHETTKGFLNDTPEDGDDTPDAKLQKVHYISKELISMGFPEARVIALLKHSEISDIQSAIDMLIKTEHGWTHTYVPNESSGVCEICEEPFAEHIEIVLMDSRALSQQEEIMDPLNTTQIFDSDSPLFDLPLERSVECAICLEAFAFADCFSLRCGHMHCLNCVKSYLQATIENGDVYIIRCPQENCKASFTKAQIQSLCTPEVYEKYLRFKENIEVNLSKDHKWCPAPNCGKFVKGSTKKPHVVCSCGFHMCFRCGEQWHPNISCANNFKKLYQSWAKDKKIQRCPKCKIRIEKDAGCNHITCTFCHYQWCWICGQKYSHSHFDSFFFGCPLLQFTSTDWGLGKIALYQILVLLLWPLLCLVGSFKYAIVFACSSECSGFLWVFLQLLTIIVFPFIIWAVMIIPTFIYKLYTLFYLLIRACGT